MESAVHFECHRFLCAKESSAKLAINNQLEESVCVLRRNAKCGGWFFQGWLQRRCARSKRVSATAKGCPDAKRATVVRDVGGCKG